MPPHKEEGDSLGPLLRGHVTVEVEWREYGDAWFAGQGPKGPVQVGVEVKKANDLLNSMADGRLSGHQLPGLLAAYQVVYLLVEGLPRLDDGGGILLEKVVSWPGGRKTILFPPKGNRIGYSELQRRLCTIENKCAVRVRYSADRRETAQVLIDLAAWWSRPWASHKSHQAFDSQRPERLLLVKPTPARSMIKEIPGIGWEKSKAALQHFGTIEAAVTAPIEEWAKIPGIGRPTAQKIYDFFRRRAR